VVTRRRYHGAAVRLLALAAAFLARDGATQPTTPFRSRDLNPLVIAFALPQWPALDEAADHEVTLSTDLANYFRFTRKGDEAITLDGEIWRTSVNMRWRVAEDWFLAAELPYYEHFGGILDNAVDGWHSAFNLPDEGRNARPENLLEYRLAGSQGLAVLLDHRVRGWGDVQLSVAHHLGQRPLVWQATVQVASGDRDALTGGAGAGAAMTLSGGRSGTWRAHAAGLYWGAGAVWPTDPRLPGFATRSLAYVGTFGIGWQRWSRIGLKAQLDLHSPFYDARLQEIGATSVQAALGGWWSTRPGRLIEFAVTEDLGVGTAADFALHVAMRWDW
jgi:Protein of unknown function (DUF3187)